MYNACIQYNASQIKSRSTTSVRLSASAAWLQTHSQSPWNGNDTPCSKHEGNCLLLHSASRAPNIDNYAPDIQPQPLTLTSGLDPDLWPWTPSKVTGDKHCSLTRRSVTVWPLSGSIDHRIYCFFAWLWTAHSCFIYEKTVRYCTDHGQILSINNHGLLVSFSLITHT